MSEIYASYQKPTREEIPDGKYPAILSQIIQIGRQRFSKGDREWFSPQIILGFELPTVTYQTKDDETMSTIKSGTYFLSLNESRNGVGLREILNGLRGTEEWTVEELEKFALRPYLGRSCFITLEGVESKGKVYQNIVAVEPNDTTPTPLRDPLFVTTEDFGHLETVNVPQWVKDKIAASQEFQRLSEMVSAAENMGPDEPEMTIQIDDDMTKDFKLDAIEF